jgi:hypothetical protein
MQGQTRSAAFRTAGAAAMLALAGCSGSPTATPTPTPGPAPPPVAVASYDTSKCFDQPIPGAPAGANTLRKLIFPDTVKLDLNQPAVFPNGRHPRDPVVDILLALLFVDLSETGQSTRTFADLPLNPGGNDRPLPDDFPFLAPPQGNSQPPDTSGTNFDFRSDPDSAFIRIDRMGQPAIGPVLIGAARRNVFNDANPVDDNAGTFVGDVEASLQALFLGIGDDLTTLGLKTCGVPK